MKNRIFPKFILSFLFLFYAIFPVEVRLKDISKISGLRENQISGYGVVTGLLNSGDTKSPIASETLKSFLRNKGINVSDVTSSKNIAAVMITANVPVYAKPGDKIDVTVSSIGDAKSLEGGVLLQSPLKASNGQTIAVASGVISFGGKDDKVYNLNRTRPKTVGFIQGGGIVETEVQPIFFNKENRYKLTLEYQDFATLEQVRKAIQETFQITEQVAQQVQQNQVNLLKPQKMIIQVVSPTEIEIQIPEQEDPVSILAKLENIVIIPENKAKVVINERTGTIVMGANVTVEEVAISKQGISIVIRNPNKPYWSRDPDPEEHIMMVKEASTVADLVKALNKIGASTKDIIGILEALKKSGALHAEVIVQ